MINKIKTLDDGIVKIWSLSNNQETMCGLNNQISSFKAIPYFTSSFIKTQTPALLTTWNPKISTLCVGGWSDKIYYWDLNVEKLSTCLSINTSFPITSLNFTDENSLIFCTYSGHLGIYDKRSNLNLTIQKE